MHAVQLHGRWQGAPLSETKTGALLMVFAVAQMSTLLVFCVPLEQHCLWVAYCVDVAEFECLQAKVYVCLPGMVQPTWFAALLTLRSGFLTLFLNQHAFSQ